MSAPVSNPKPRFFPWYVTLAGPLVGAVSFTWLQDQVARSTEFWRALLGAIILLLVLAFPRGIAGFAGQLAGLVRHRRMR